MVFHSNGFCLLPHSKTTMLQMMLSTQLQMTANFKYQLQLWAHIICDEVSFYYQGIFWFCFVFLNKADCPSSNDSSGKKSQFFYLVASLFIGLFMIYLIQSTSSPNGTEMFVTFLSSGKYFGVYGIILGTMPSSLEIFICSDCFYYNV